MSSDKKIIQYSNIESDTLGLKIGRCNTDYFDENQLCKEILEGEYDICRLKSSSEDELVPLRLHRIGFPCFFSGSIRRYKTHISEKPKGNFLHEGLIFERYDGTQDILLKQMLIDTWGSYPIGYYRTPFLQEIINKEIEIESVYRFYKKYNLQKDYPNNTIIFIRDNDDYVGFFALNILDGNLESHIGGILKSYQKEGYFLDMLHYIKLFCLENKLKYFIFGARNENAQVQKIFQEVGFKSIGSENVFHITPLLSCNSNEKEIIKKELIIINNSKKEQYYILKNELNKISNLLISDKTSSETESIKILSEIIPGKYLLHFKFPIKYKNTQLILLKLFNTKGEIVSFGYSSILS